MKAIKILDTDETSEYIVLINFMGWKIDKEDHVLQLHRYIDEEDTVADIQLNKLHRYRTMFDDCIRTAEIAAIVERKMEEFLANDQYILDISEYVDQEVMGRGDEEEQTLLKQYIEGMTPQKVRLILGELGEEEKKDRICPGKSDCDDCEFMKCKLDEEEK